MTDTLIKGTQADISPRLWEELLRSFPMSECRYTDGATLESLARAGGHQDVIDWIRARAKLTAFS